MVCSNRLALVVDLVFFCIGYGLGQDSAYADLRWYSGRAFVFFWRGGGVGVAVMTSQLGNMTKVALDVAV